MKQKPQLRESSHIWCAWKNFGIDSVYMFRNTALLDHTSSIDSQSNHKFNTIVLPVLKGFILKQNKTKQKPSSGSVDWAPAYKPKGPGSIPSQGTCLGFGSGPLLGARERQPHIDVSLPLFLPPFPLL